MIEFPHDTTRAITSLLISGTFSRCRDIRFVFPHAGGTLPFLANRIARTPTVVAQVPEGALEVFRRLNYDTASSANPMAFGALMQLVTPRNVLLGTDFPFGSAAAMKAGVDGLRQLGLDEASVRAVESGNAAELFPRFRPQIS